MYFVITDRKQITPTELVGSLGSILNLWAGITVLFIIEVIEVKLSKMANLWIVDRLGHDTFISNWKRHGTAMILIKIITARQRSCEKVVFSVVSVCSRLASGRYVSYWNAFLFFLRTHWSFIYNFASSTLKHIESSYSPFTAFWAKVLFIEERNELMLLQSM